jgi:GNAT superfamily N-acetyltransferase
MTSVRFRSAGRPDAPILRPFMEAFYREGGFEWHDEVSRALDSLLADPNLGRVWVIEEAGEDVGYVALCFGFSLEFQGRDAFLDEVYVAPHVRGRGLGRAALAFVVTEAGRLGVRAIHLEAAGGDPRLRDLYESLGFRERPHPFMTRRLDP